MEFTSNFDCIKYTQVDLEWFSIIVRKYLKPSWLGIRKWPHIITVNQVVKREVDLYEWFGKDRGFCLAKEHTIQWSSCTFLFGRIMSGIDLARTNNLESDGWP